MELKMVERLVYQTADARGVLKVVAKVYKMVDVRAVK